MGHYRPSDQRIAQILHTVEAMLRAGTCSIDYHRDIHEVPPTFSSRWQEYRTSPTLKLSIRGTVPVNYRAQSSPDVKSGTLRQATLVEEPLLDGKMTYADAMRRAQELLEHFTAKYCGPWKNNQNPERHHSVTTCVETELTNVRTRMIIYDPNAGVQQEGAVVKVKKEKRRRFYVGKPGVMESAWAKGTLQEAVDQATAIVEQTGEEQVVVQVVRVVRRKPQPIVVEAVK